MRKNKELCFLILLIVATVGCDAGSKLIGHTGDGENAVVPQSDSQAEPEPMSPSDRSEASGVHRVFKPALSTRSAGPPSLVPPPTVRDARTPAKPEYELLSEAVSDLQRMLAENDASETTKTKSKR